MKARRTMKANRVTLPLLSALLVLVVTIAPRVLAGGVDVEAHGAAPETDAQETDAQETDVAETSNAEENGQSHEKEQAEVAGDVRAGDDEHVLSVEEILASEPKDSDYRDGESRTCISRRTIRDLEHLDNRTLIVKERGKRVWLNQYAGTCIGTVRRDHIPVLTTRTGSSFLCSGDELYWVDAFGMGGRVSCRIGRFERISEERAEALRVAIEHRNETERTRSRNKKRRN